MRVLIGSLLRLDSVIVGSICARALSGVIRLSLNLDSWLQMSFSGSRPIRAPSPPSARFSALRVRLTSRRLSSASRISKPGRRPATWGSIRSWRAARPWKVPSQDGAGPPSSAARIRLLISVAALFVKVTARTRPAATPPAAIRWTTAAVSVLVLPVPAPASTRTGPSCAAALACTVVRPAIIEYDRGSAGACMAAPLGSPVLAGGRLQFVHAGEEEMRRQIGRPWFPRARALERRQWIIREWLERDAETFSHCLPAPAGDMERLAGGGEPVGMLVHGVTRRCPDRQPVALSDGRLQPPYQCIKARSKMRLERGDRIPAA